MGQYRIIQNNASITSRTTTVITTIPPVPNVELGRDLKPPGTHFKGAPMPYFMRIVGGARMHAEYPPGYPASQRPTSACLSSWPKAFSDRSSRQRRSHDCHELENGSRSCSARLESARPHSRLSLCRAMIIITNRTRRKTRSSASWPSPSLVSIRQINRGAARVIVNAASDREDLAREKPLAALPGVEAIVPVLRPRNWLRRISPTIVGCDRRRKRVGGQENISISGPCSVESREQILSIARAPSKNAQDFCAVARLNRALRLTVSRDCARDVCAAQARAEKLPVITEIMDARDLPIVEKIRRLVRRLARATCRTFPAQGGRSRLPVLLKRGFSATISDLILSAEYILNEGNMNVLLRRAALCSVRQRGRVTRSI